MDGARNVLAAGAELKGQHAFGDHVRGSRSQDVDAQDPVGFPVGQDFDEALEAFETAREEFEKAVKELKASEKPAEI